MTSRIIKMVSSGKGIPALPRKIPKIIPDTQNKNIIFSNTLGKNQERPPILLLHLPH